MKNILILVLLISSAAVQADKLVTLNQAQSQNLGIEVGPLQQIKDAPVLDAPAKVSIPPKNDYIVSTLYAGLIKKISVTVGDTVKKGQILAIINSPELLKLQQHHLTAVNEVTLSKAEFLRDEKLHSEGVISDRRWLKTAMSHQVSQSYVNETRQLLAAAGFSKKQISSLESKHNISSQLYITSPITGVVLERMVKSGQRADALAPLFHVANLKQLWLDISLPQQRAQEISVGDRVSILGSDMNAYIVLLGQNVNETTQTVLARAVIVGNNHQLRAGQVLSVKISKKNDATMYQVPSAALVKLDGMSTVFVKTSAGFMAKTVQVLGKNSQNWIVSGALKETDTIALKGTVALKANLLGLGGDE